MNYYLKSSNVRVFPFGQTRPTDLNGRVLNEQNLSNLIRMLTDKPGYVISYDDENNYIEFVINGYYFEAKLDADLLASFNGANMYAVIKLKTENNYTQLEGGDIAESVITSGEGTMGSPFVLSSGNYSEIITREENFDTYYQYTYDFEGTVTIDKGSSPKISISHDDSDFTDSTDTHYIDHGIPGDKITFSVDLTSTGTATLSMTLGHADAFTGVTFVTSLDELSGNIASLNLGNVQNGKLNIPTESFVKFDVKSIDNAMSGVDMICGKSASEMVKNI